ncbi:MAG TPA: hypothetical protein VM118_06445 [Acidobacteriota bacterium]|nr:hypothetical protein [Acidobacteriota bacterium]
MKKVVWTLLIVIGALSGDIATAADQGFLFGTITTEWGDEYTGRIRWDKNEGFWDDILDATKEDDDRYDPKYRPRKRISIFGIKIFTDENWDFSYNSSSQLRFGHIKSIEPRSRGRAQVRLKSGETIRFEDAGTDLGSSNRGITIDDPDEGIVDLKWRDIDRVEFFAEPDDYVPTDTRVGRLYGRVTTENNETFVGFVIWDADEIYSTDILDGEDRDRDREVPFDRIASIQRRGSRGSLVTLTTGRELKLHGTNDVDDGHRGVGVNIATLGRVEINWDDFDKVEFLDIPATAIMRYDDFDGGRRLQGTVTTDYGDTFTGDIAWDNDERFTWECLNGDQDDVEYDIEFGQIARIERQSRRSCTVTLKDGTKIRLSGSNDVDEDNKGIFIETVDGDLEEMDWDDFEVVVFKDM